MVTYPARTMKQSSLFQESARYVSLPNTPMADILTIISKAKNVKIKWSNPSSMWQRMVVHTWSLHGWNIPRVRQLRRMTNMLIRSNHVQCVKETTSLSSNNNIDKYTL